MCGILGIIGPRPDGCDAQGALETLSHRGPDDRGVFTEGPVWLGHRRLSILDLGPGGHQPMVEPQSGVVVTYNGEIYNYVELRRDLEARGHVFRSRSDTEVLVHSYLEWGVDCVERFNGMWAFLLWDPLHRRAFFSRDRFGVKPFCYAIVDDSLAVASEPKALVHAFPALREPDTSAIRDLLVQRREHHDERTFYASIKSLPAGCRATFRVGDRSPRIEAYWRYPEGRPDTAYDEPAARQRFSSLVTDAVALRLRSDVPVGITISGGVDSTVILDAMAGIRAARGMGVSSYTAQYDHSPGHPTPDEGRWARLAAQRYPHVRLTEVPAPRERWLDVLKQIVWHMDGPSRSPQVFPMWTIMQRARADRVPVLLEGQGADELFGGYAHYAALAVIDRLLEGPRSAPGAGWSAVGGAARAGARASSAARVLKDIGLAAVPPLSRFSARRTSLAGVLAPDFVEDCGRSGRQYATSTVRSARGRLEAQLRQDFSHDILPGALRFGDTVSMAHSIEIRLPFLDYRLVEFAATLPPPALIAAGWTKRLMRDHLRRVGQREIADRPDKKGFPTPAWTWLAAGQGGVLREILLDRGARIRALVDVRRLERMIARHGQGRYTAGEALYSLLTTELWWQRV